MHDGQKLTETMSRISVVLGANPTQAAAFEQWALGKMKHLVNAQRDSRASLQWQAMELRQEYLELQKDISTGISVTGRTELMRAARKEWLGSLLEFVDSLLERAAA